MIKKFKILRISFLVFCLLMVFAFGSFLLYSDLQTETIDLRIKELTPTFYLNENYKNIKIIGFDVLDKDKNHLKSKKFFQEDVFYIVLYFKKKMVSGSGPSVQAFPECQAVLEYQEGGYFWNEETIRNFYQDKQLDLSSREWQIGGIYKIGFKFKIPKYAFPGKYRLKLAEENDPHPRRGELLNINDIVIHVQTQIQKREYLDEHNLFLGGCLLDPARATNNIIRYSWFGSAKFYLIEDLRNFKKMIVVGKGAVYRGNFSLLKISTEHEEIGEVTLSSEWEEYEFELNLKKESHVLDVQRFKGGGMTIKMIKLCK